MRSAVRGKLLVAVATSAAAVVVMGCVGTPAASLATAPTWSAHGQAKCSVSTSQAEPLVVEWPSADRAKLEALSRHGAVAVEYAGCHMRVLAQCAAPGKYVWTGTTRKASHERITDVDQLYTKLPFGAATLEAELSRSGELNVDMIIVGRYQIDHGEYHVADLSGPDCASATHVVTALTAGAFEFFAGAQAAVGARASVFDKGAGGESRATRSDLNSDGVVASCDHASSSDAAPPEGCGALIRLEVTPIVEVKAQLAVDDQKREAERAAPAHRRKNGYIIGAVGLGSLAVAGLFAYLGAKQNTKVQDGGLSSGTDISGAASTGHTENLLGYVFTAVGVVGVGIGGALVFFNPDPLGPTVGVRRVPSGAIGWTVRLP